MRQRIIVGLCLLATALAAPTAAAHTWVAAPGISDCEEINPGGEILSVDIFNDEPEPHVGGAFVGNLPLGLCAGVAVGSEVLPRELWQTVPWIELDA